MDELPIPSVVKEATRSVEVARIWIADEFQIVALTPNLWADPGTWGMMMVDLARHLSKQYARAGWREEEVLSRIRALFDAEWDHPTDADIGPRPWIGAGTQ